MKNREGSYKKILFTKESLIAEGELLASHLNLLRKIKTQLSDFEFCTLYILTFLRIRHSRNWLQQKSYFSTENNERKMLTFLPEEFHLSVWEKNKLFGVSFRILFQCFNLKGIPLAVNRTMLNWDLGLYRIFLLNYIPLPRELLRLQVQKARCVTLLLEKDEINELVLSSRDPLSFVLHDLHHADQFFSQEKSLQGQLGFYFLLNKIYDFSAIKKMLTTDSQFRREFEYISSDMNAYVVHLFKCLKSTLLRVDSRYSTSLFLQLLDWWNMPHWTQEAACRLNTPCFTGDDEKMLNDFFENAQGNFV